MPATDLIQRERAVLRELLRLAEARPAEQARLDASHRELLAALASERETRLAELDARWHSDQAQAERDFTNERQRLVARYDAERQAAQENYRTTFEDLSQQLVKQEKQAEKELTEARWLAQSVYEAEKKRRKQQFDEIRQQLQGRLEAALASQREASAFLDHLNVDLLLEPASEPPPADEPPADSVAELNRSISAAEAQLQQLKGLRLLSTVYGSAAIGIFALPALVLIPVVGLIVGWNQLLALILAAALSGGLGLGIVYWLRASARTQASEVLAALVASVDEAGRQHQRCLKRAEMISRRQIAEAKAKRDADTLAATEKFQPVLEAARTRRESELPRLTTSVTAHLAELRQRHETDLRTLAQRQADRARLARESFQQARDELSQSVDQRQAAQQASFQQRRATQSTEWQKAFSAAKLELTAIRREIEKTSPDWKSRAWFDWEPPAELTRAISFGRMTLDLKTSLSDSAAADGEPGAPSFELSLPALLGFPHDASLFVRAQDQGSRRAIELLQIAALRLLTTVPPGKLRLTIIDPVGLGQNFAAFMHLADFDEALVSHRIWTEPHLIEQRLGDLTAHMETVIQKYLRSEFPTIEDYNAKAGEIAEPFRLLVVANFPTGFTENAARRLASIIAAGPRCGVYTLLSAEAGATLPGGLKPADLTQHANVFAATSEGITWRDPDFEALPLVVDEPPPADWCKNILQRVGAAAIKAKRVEVPFEAIAPAPERYWTFDSRSGVDVPLGRAGATQLQHLKLGQGTAQHVLIAGKTGSGKSTLLHALIVNAALRYSPDELELYLIDFKKGVEFKTYVTHQLPHARVVAIESEREFGLSVMQRLDAEMNARGEQFRELGVQDIAGFRNAGGKLPRILLLVDEFQEFFVADDKLSQDASLLLDRLVRQGRAFGIHIHLGSQTLGGAYSLARSTLGQMAIRIALQCSESDANLILSEDNSAARLLSRPGEAIYNDANGMVEGNHPFQVVWLPDDRREEFLRRIQELDEKRPATSPRRQIVFEGMQPADLTRNLELGELLAAPPPSAAPRLPQTWLGEPLAISAATSTTFPRRSGANLLCLGQNDEAVAGMMTAALVGLAGQLPPLPAPEGERLAALQIWDGGTLDGPQAGPFRRLAKGLPEQIQYFHAHDFKPSLERLFVELERRRAADASAISAAPPLFVFLYDLSRFRELRKQEDDFGFSGFSSGGDDKPAPKPDKQFAELLREGPSVGIHLLVWCDTLTNFNRTLDRQGLREFDTRILLQMSSADSSLLIDVAAASQLGRRRALLHREDEGRLEKFRPFAAPGDEWLDQIVDQLGQRGGVVAPPERQTGASR
ncbi:MAG: hypothetical protein JNG90_17135 [Planctomycetaceae bacterium]|nr:hypothetical protein [Planctomycetaceae bacterium]